MTILRSIEVEVDLPVSRQLRYLSGEIRTFLQEHRINTSVLSTNPITGQPTWFRFDGSPTALQSFEREVLSREDPHTYSLYYQ